jgi:hypothetical protein
VPPWTPWAGFSFFTIWLTPANAVTGAASKATVSESKDQEVERLRAILRNAHDPSEPLAKKLMRGLKALVGARIRKKAMDKRVRKPPGQHAA